MVVKTSDQCFVEKMRVKNGYYSGPVLEGEPHGEGEWADWRGVFTGIWHYGKRRVARFKGKRWNSFNVKL